MKYPEQRFTEENAPVKRKIERDMMQIILDDGIKGSVLGLTGPNIKAHYENYKLLMDNNRHKIIVAENNKEVFDHINKDIDLYPRLQLHYEDVFKVVTYKKPPLALLDLDFTVPIESLYEQGFQRNIVKAFKQNKFMTRFALIVTHTPRNSYVDADDMYEFIKKKALQHDYYIITKYERHYAESNSQPMGTCLFTFHKRGKTK